MAFARLFPLLAFLLLSFAFTATALKCKFLTVDLTPAGGDQSDKKSDEKEYECPKQDKYCVVLGGVLWAPPKNLTFALRSCESDVKRYMDPISEKIGQKLDYACERADGKNHTVGPLTYWYNCCTSDDCNNAALGQFSASAVIFSLISASLVLSPLLLV